MSYQRYHELRKARCSPNHFNWSIKCQTYATQNFAKHAALVTTLCRIWQTISISLKDIARPDCLLLIHCI